MRKKFKYRDNLTAPSDGPVLPIIILKLLLINEENTPENKQKPTNGSGPKKL